MNENSTQQPSTSADNKCIGSGQETTPLVSIVMPTYNRAHLVGEAIDSVLKQTYPHFELILVNDGSRDTTRDVLAEYAARDSRIRVINKENEGIPDTVNRGWRESRGEYVTWSSDDNLFHPEAIEAMVVQLQSHPEVALVYTDCRDVDAAGKPLGTTRGADPETLETHCAIAGCLLFRRSVFDKVDMFRKHWTRCHDFDFYHRLYKQFAVIRIKRELYDYRVHDESMSGNVYAIQTECAELLSSYAATWTGRRTAWGNCWAEMARHSVRTQHPWRAVWYQFRAALLQPSRFPSLWRQFWTTSYRLVPRPVQVCWRGVKRLAGGTN